MRTFVMLIGAPGCGKSYLVNNQLKNEYTNATIINYDDINNLLLDSADIITNTMVQDKIKELIFAAIANSTNIIYDATNTYKSERKLYLNLIPKEYKKIAYFIKSNLKICLSQQLNRTRRVPMTLIDKFLLTLEEPSYDEGFDTIIIIDKTASDKIKPRTSHRSTTNYLYF